MNRVLSTAIFRAESGTYFFLTFRRGFRGFLGESPPMYSKTALSSKSALYSLEKAWFALDGDMPSVTIQAANAKNRRQETQPLRLELTADLKAYFKEHAGDRRAFPTMRRGRGAEMLRPDLEAAGIPYKDASGLVFDFHALRHQFGTMLSRSGVPLAMAQKMMRHSVPKLTTNIYTHATLSDKADELAKLPKFFSKKSKNAKKMETESSD